MIGWTTGERMHWKSSARKVPHLSPIPALTMEVPWDPGLNLEFKPSSMKHYLLHAEEDSMSYFHALPWLLRPSSSSVNCPLCWTMKVWSGV